MQGSNKRQHLTVIREQMRLWISGEITFSSFKTISLLDLTINLACCVYKELVITLLLIDQSGMKSGLD